MKTSHLLLSRWSWFAVVGVAFGARDVCLGGGHPPPDPDPAPADAGASDAKDDATMSSLPARPVGRTLARLHDDAAAGLRARRRGPA